MGKSEKRRSKRWMGGLKIEKMSRVVEARAKSDQKGGGNGSDESEIGLGTQTLEERRGENYHKNQRKKDTRSHSNQTFRTDSEQNNARQPYEEKKRLCNLNLVSKAGESDLTTVRKAELAKRINSGRRKF